MSPEFTINIPDDAKDGLFAFVYGAGGEVTGELPVLKDPDGYPTRSISELAKHHGVQQQTLKIMLKQGVKPEDLEEVAELRNALCEYYPCSDLDKGGKIANQLSVRSIIKAYHTVERDLDTLGDVINDAQTIAADLQMKNNTTHLPFDRAIRIALKRHLFSNET